MNTVHIIYVWPKDYRWDTYMFILLTTCMFYLLSITCTVFFFLIIVKSFTELGPQLLRIPNVEYLLSEVFSQDPLERYFSRQRHRGGSNDNPSAEQVPLNAMTLIQQQAIYRDIKTMNIEQEVSTLSACQPLKKRQRRQ